MQALKSFLLLFTIIIGILTPALSFSIRQIPSLSTVPKSIAHYLFASSSNDPSDDGDIFRINIALTREVDKNDKLKEMIYNHPTTKMLESTLQLNCVELPCIEHATGPDIELFQHFVENFEEEKKPDYIVITSPESAKVFSDVINSSTNGNALLKDGSVKIAAVGKATKSTLTKLGFNVDFVPSKANGETLATELTPVDKVKLNRVVYPASAKAENTIQDMLEQRKDASFTVKRFNTYDTVPCKLKDDVMEMVMDDIQIACFGSPSSVDAWLDNVDRILGIENMSDEDKKATPGCNGFAVAVCIGSTTAKRCLETGRWHATEIYYPKTNPGIEGWADCCLTAAGDIMENSFWS